MNKYIIFVIIFVFFNLSIFSVTNEEKALAGFYQYKITEDTQFLSGTDYESFICIVLFQDGRYVKYEKTINKINKLDIKYKPINNGVFNVDKGLLYLQPLVGMFEIYYIKTDRLIGNYTDFVYIKVE
ncbi:MAG TPA: hypothetical protein PK771_07600 [Spirochaetota bacterium]|nr:hypothetical protein [Spirochaetota bacterium]